LDQYGCDSHFCGRGADIFPQLQCQRDAGGFLNVGLRRRVAALKRCISSLAALTFSSSCVVFEFFWRDFVSEFPEFHPLAIDVC